MSYLQFSVPPIPHYLNVGEVTYLPGERHPNRRNIGVFDILFVSRGSLHISEDGAAWKVSRNEALVLCPDGHHFSVEGCDEVTHFYWLHFNAEHWRQVAAPQHFQTDPFERSTLRQNRFNLHVPKYCRLPFPERTFTLLKNLMIMMDQPSSLARWKEQSIFQDLLQQLMEMEESRSQSAPGVIAEKAALYLRQNYKEQIDYEKMGRDINYNPTYISRCMKQVFYCTPLDYLKHYRLEQSKMMLINTDFHISAIAEEVGFPNVSYFTKCFKEYEKMGPRMFRSKYRALTTKRWDISD
ncbi:helix-turn-helix domain-containing protein [Paenibacillus piri]|uniref:AraC family transcriptional regulator n=1 Tax=Paenibacillus piri TaxID=2547395 RepID=A0A4R5K9H3_9BACL|nr:AraC family transcriptional regulator [Paenibacillus piri]TDF88915.1 AraC family transcriptional regulator [Paenibacillus piri]